MKNKNLQNNRALRFYNQVLGLERLHYGLWEKEHEFSLHGLKLAQEKYEQNLISLIPAKANRLLDVGCGSGIMSKNLKEKGFDVEGLSPDINQQKVFIKKTNAKFHLCRFEDFVPKTKYDCIIMSESSQYINLSRLFQVSKDALKPGGCLLVSDYFVLDKAKGLIAKSGHPLDKFINAAKQNGFKIELEKDITEQTVKTLDLAYDFILNRVVTAIDIAFEKFKQKHRQLFQFFYRLLSAIFRKKISILKEQIVLIDSNEFIKNKRYKLFIFKLR